MTALTVSEAAAEALRRADPALGAWIDRLGPLRRETDGGLFPAVVHQIAAQQVSGKAAETVWRRLEEIPMDAPSFLAAGEARLRAAGLSGRKASYILGFAQKVADGALDLESLAAQPDGAVVEALSACRGIGPWTAEMVLLFGLGRPDVLSFGDFGIRKGLCVLHGLETLDRPRFDRFRTLYSPYGSTASLYLWEIARLS